MCTRLITANITELTSLLFLFIGCAGTTLTEEEEYERHEAYVQMVIEYDNKVKGCSQSGDLMVTTGPRTRNTGGKMSAAQMRAARCVSRR